MQTVSVLLVVIYALAVLPTLSTALDVQEEKLYQALGVFPIVKTKSTKMQAMCVTNAPLLVCPATDQVRQAA